jgi:DNA polymerase (family 10)
LIDGGDLKSELHSHTLWSDGRLPVLEMAQAAIRRGKKVLAITDHSGSLGVAGGLTVERLREQREEIRRAQEVVGDQILLLQGSEVEILADGRLDFPDEFLAELDVVIASLHSSLRQPREKITQRLIGVIRNPNVDIIGHPTGRMIPDREGADLDMDAVLEAARESGVALEINAHPARLDLNDIYTRQAIEMGILLSINTDAHSEADLDLAFFGVATARRGWAEAKDVINTWEPKRLLEWLRGRG